MKFKLESSVFEEKAIVKTFSRDFRTDVYREETIVLDKESLNGTVRQIQLNGFCLIIKDIKIPAGYTVQVTANATVFKLHFELEGDYSYTPASKSSPVMKIPGGHFNILYFTNLDGTLSYNTTSRKTLEVLFTKDFLEKAAGEDYDESLRGLNRYIEKGENFMFWEKSRSIPLELQQNIQELISCRYCGHIKKIYLEARITALLLNLLVNPTAEDEARALSKPEYAGIQRVEEYIRKDFNRNITIADLAPIAGINTSKLKQRFKQVHGTTIFKYITRIRMERAKEWITTEKLSISEAAYKVGYKNPQHFTVAFKKYYGYLPSSLIGMN